jgi:transmembrane sensor
MSNLDQLSRGVAALQDEQLAATRTDLGQASEALGQHLLDRSTARRRRRNLATLTTLSAAAIVVLTATWFVGHPRNVRDATVATVRAQVGQRLEASLLDVAVAFEDGSRVVLASGARLRTTMLGPSSATLDLEKGRAHVHVVHTKDTRWMVRAGGYAVAVTGTRFRVDWRPETGAFSVVVEEGKVRVSGGLLNQAVDIAAGQSLGLQNPQPGTTALGAPEPRAPSAPSPTIEPSTAPSIPPEVAPATHSNKHASHPAPTLSWQSQAEAGHYRDALAAAESKGFDGICRLASAADLLTLAEAARYAGRGDRAEQALQSVRARFGHSEDSATAAYVLGRIAADNRRSHDEAARWFRTYLAERPDGRLSREAEGRLLESLAFMDRETAREAARAYLRHYPSGPHAAFARNLLGQ